jgi:3-methylfumaryl-CoA hydratase
MAALGPDGHPARGGFLPPVPLPRRMWAGGQLQFQDRLQVGDEVTRTSRITDVTLKSGSTGPLCFVTVEHMIESARGIAIRERQDIVYREMAITSPAPYATPAAAPPGQHRRTHFADPVLLFRYSALTFNGHRIHYDRDYVTKVEGYPGLVFHGPLQAALLIEFAAALRGDAGPKRFDYRCVTPLFDSAVFSLNANNTASGLDVWTANATGVATMKAMASW